MTDHRDSSTHTGTTGPHAADRTGADGRSVATRPAARSQSGSVARRVTTTVDANPLPVLVGGLAVGALVAAILPRSQRESDLLGPLGKRLTDTASSAARAAADAGKAELDTLGLNRNAARDQVGKVMDGVMKALSSAGSAAVAATTAKP